MVKKVKTIVISDIHFMTGIKSATTLPQYQNFIDRIVSDATKFTIVEILFHFVRRSVFIFTTQKL